MGRQVKEGDEITPGDVLCDVETDKATMVKGCMIRDAIYFVTISHRVSQAPGVVVFHWLYYCTSGIYLR